MCCNRLRDCLPLADVFGYLVPITDCYRTTCGICHFECLLEAQGLRVQHDLYAVAQAKRREAADPFLARDMLI
jgi:hypothetical protein